MKELRMSVTAKELAKNVEETLGKRKKRKILMTKKSADHLVLNTNSNDNKK